MGRLAVIVALGWVVLCLSCSRRSDDSPRVASDDGLQSDGLVLAVVGERRITMKDFQAELKRRSRTTQDAFSTEEQRQKLLQEMVRFEVLLAQARAAGYDRKPEIQALVNEFIVAQFQEDQLAQKAGPAPSEAEVRRFFEQHQERFTTAAAVRMALIYFKCSSKATHEKREEMKRKAEAVLAEARATDAEGFSRLAQQHSDDQSTRYTGGDAGWLQQAVPVPQWDAAVLNAAFAISEPGTCAPLVETPSGFYIVRLLQRKAGGIRPFEQVKEAITYQLAQQREHQQRQDFFEEMKRGLEVEVHPEALKSISTPDRAAESHPPPLPKS